MDSKLSFEGFRTVNSLQNCFLHSKLETSLLCLGSAVCFRYVVRSLKKNNNMERFDEEGIDRWKNKKDNQATWHDLELSYFQPLK